MFRLPKLLSAGLVLATLTGCVEKEMRDLEEFVAATKNKSYGQTFEPLPELEPYRPFTYTAEGLKDPFALSAFIEDALARQDLPVFENNGIAPDLTRAREELEKYALGSLQMVGTFRDFDNTGLWALVKAPDGIVHRIRKGNYLGDNFGQVYNVTEERIDLQEIVPDDTTGGWRERESFLTLPQ